MKRLRILCIVLIAIVSISNYAQDINFDDLQRSGSPLAKIVSINGLAAEGLRYRDQFIRNDDVRVEEYNQALSRYSSSSSSSSGSSSSSSSSSSNSQKGSGLKVFQCKIYCKSASGPTTYKKVQAASRREAAKMVGDNADQICANDGKSYASSRDFPESQCSEQ